VTRPRSRPVLRFVCAIVLTVFALGCASSRQELRGALQRITEVGEIRVGMTGEQPPLTMIARGGEFIGLDVALMRVLAQNMGVEARFVRLPFDELLDALDAGEIDVVMSGMTITPERAKRAAFVGPYFTSGKSVLTRSREIADVVVATDLDRADLRLVALAGSTSEDFARATLPAAQLALTKGLEEAIGRVIDGSADALLADREIGYFATLRHPDAGLIVGAATLTVEPMGIAVPLDQPHLAGLIQKYLIALEERGAIEKAKDYWFENPAWVANLR
jgi:polar amino acid transport system substrate-binding protein